MTKILAQAEYQAGSLAVVHCFNHSKNLEKPIHNLIKWALYNSQPLQTGSPALDILKDIYNDVT